MNFDPAFNLLVKFAPNVTNYGISVDRIEDADLRIVSTYLGVDIRGLERNDCCRIIEDELMRQNEFLNYNLEAPDVTESDIYKRSNFVREVIKNNRENSPAPKP